MIVMKKTNLINGQKPEFGNLEQIKILQEEGREAREKAEFNSWYRDLSEGERYFYHFTNVDMAKGMIAADVKKIEKIYHGRSVIELMIDKSTLYDRALLKGFILRLKEGYEFLIDNFKKMGADGAEELKEYTKLLKNIDENLNGEFKNIKAVDFAKIKEPV